MQRSGILRHTKGVLPLASTSPYPELVIARHKEHVGPSAREYF